MAARKTVKPAHGRNRTAIETTIEALRQVGRLEPVDAARVALAQALADAVDADPSNASLWREYRAAESALREVDDSNQDDFALLLDALSAEVGDNQNSGA